MDLDNLQTFHSLFSNWRFHVPDYQRGYAWGEKQWKELMDDLSTLTEDNEHFTGLLVLHENKDPGLRLKTRGIALDVYDVVDGQQRLTTILILLNAIRQEMERLNTGDMPEIAESICSTYLYEPGAGSLLVYKLVLDRNNYDFFVHNILGVDAKDIGGPQMQSHHNLLGARDFFADQLAIRRAALGDTYPAWLEALYAKISKQMKVMVYRLHTEADAGVVFESMNSRGKKPNQLDLVKNYLLFLASKLDADSRRHLSTAINDAWTVVFEQLTAAGRPDDEEPLLEMHWVTTYDYDRNRWATEREKSDHIKKRFKPMLINPDQHIRMADEAAVYVRTLKNAAVAYRDIVHPGHSSAFQIFASQPDLRAQVILWSMKLTRLGSLRPFIPLLTALRLKHSEDAAVYLQAVQLCEKYAFRVFRVANARPSGAEALLFRLANQVYNGLLNPASAFEEIRRNLLARCSDAVLSRSFDINELTPWYRRSGLAYFLYEYEEELFKPNEPIINWQTILQGGEKSIEHILPQNPPEAGYWADRFTPEERQHFQHQIGNLTLILANWNSSLGVKPFPKKKGVQGQSDPCYANSDLKITRALVTVADWNPQALAERQKGLSDWALKRWYVEPPPTLPDNALEALRQRAINSGLGDVFARIHALAARLGLPPKANKNRMSYKSPRNYKWSVLKLYYYDSGIDFSLNFWAFPQYAGVDEARIRQIFENKEYWWVPVDQVEGLLKRLEQLANEVEQKRGK
jgi:hypothetical protein